jgi:hypothetical protein
MRNFHKPSKPYVSQYRREQVQDGLLMWAIAIAIAVALFVPAFL